MSDGFFIAALSQAVAIGDIVEVSGREGHHAAVVRRTTIGEELTITDGSGLGVRAVTTAAGKGGLEARVVDVLHADEPKPRFVCIQALPKNDRVEQAIDLLTEVGVDQIVPWQASRSIVRWHGARGEKAHAKWESIAREAAKQSRRLRIPVVSSLASTADVAARLRAADAPYLFHERAEIPVVATRPTADEVVFVIGPEGGISDEELATFVEAGGTPVLMGDTVLRTATAGGVALTTLKVLAEIQDAQR